MSRKKSGSKSSGNYVYGLPLFAQKSVIPPQDLYSDVAYWYNLEKLELAWEKGTTAGISNFFAPFKGSPYGFASTLPAWYGENINQVQIQEFEFSSNILIRTMYSEDFDGVREPGTIGSLWFASRDVVTGQFQIRNGKLTGKAFTLTRQYIDDGSPAGTNTVRKANGEIISQEFTYPSHEILQWVSTDGISLGAPYTTGLGVLYPYDGGWKDIEPVTMTGQSPAINGRSANKFFPDGWELNPFGNNLI